MCAGEKIKRGNVEQGRKETMGLESKRYVILAFFPVLAATLLGLSIVCPIAANGASEKPVPTFELFTFGKTLYQKQCSACHGVSGQGDGKAAYLLYPKPRDFTRNEFRLVSTNDMTVTDEDLFKTISRGMPGSAMPSWEHLSERDRWALVYYVRYLAEEKAYRDRGEITEEMLKKEIPWEIVEKVIKKPIDPAAVVQVSKEPPVSPEAIQRGRELFVKGCAACHGLQGKGDGQQVMKDNLGLPLKPRDLTAGVFKAASSAEELYYRIAGGIPGTPMPGYQAAFTDEQIWDLIHYVQTLPEKGKEDRVRLKHNQIRVRKVENFDQNPLSDQWLRINPVFVSLTPLWWRNDRIEEVEVRAVHDGKKIGIHLVWVDATENAAVDAPQSFSDGAAIQLSGEEVPPFFAMGSPENAVTLWHWKAVWEKDKKAWSDIHSRYTNIGIDYYPSQKNYKKGNAFEAKRSKTRFHDPQYMTGWGAGNPLSNPKAGKTAEEAQAKGVGTFTTMAPKLEQVEASGIWKDGKWHLVFLRALHPAEKERLDFNGNAVSIAFAVWDGEKKDRNGQKMISIWNQLQVEKSEEKS